MHSALPRTALLAFLLAALASCKGAAHLSHEPQTDVAQRRLRVPELNALLRDIHGDLMRLAKQHAWLATYEDECHREGRLIFYMPPLDDRSLQPQQPDQLCISYARIDAERGFKYSNDVEDVAECRFPSLRARVYANVLVRGRENAPARTEIVKLVVGRCRKLHGRLAYEGSQPPRATGAATQ